MKKTLQPYRCNACTSEYVKKGMSYVGSLVKDDGYCSLSCHPNKKEVLSRANYTSFPYYVANKDAMSDLSFESVSEDIEHIKGYLGY